MVVGEGYPVRVYWSPSCLGEDVGYLSGVDIIVCLGDIVGVE
jgi:hypothetical protein